MAAASPHEIRITGHGKIRTWVEFALDYLQKNPDRPLTFHTLPPEKGKHVALPEDGQMAATVSPDGAHAAASTRKPRMHSAATTIPRLISVVEIVKREYLKTLDLALAQSGKLSGLHQYNHIGELEQPDGPEGALGPEERRQREITLALSGKRHVRQHKVPYMKVTLSRKELPDLIPAGASYQQPEIRALSKSARTRLKRKLKKANEAP